jgi:mannose-6-phosphate isomerase
MHKLLQDWLAQHAIPLWVEKGIDWERGGFFEALSPQGEALHDLPKRAMVQARQIYSFRIAGQLGLVSPEMTLKIVTHGLKFLLKHCSLPSGAFAHSVDRNGQSLRNTPDLYAQAFALFGLAHGYALMPSETLRERAMTLVGYLDRERRAPAGGYFELEDATPKYASNPQMHLFEAALAWMDVDSDPIWRSLADEMVQVCVNRMIDRETGVLGEHFESTWKPIHEQNRFVFEPGHQFEWAWLLGRYQKHTGADLSVVRGKLFLLSEKHGICSTRKTAFDEVWSDMSCKSSTSRFWPQCERIKAALQLALQAAPAERDRYFDIADEAVLALFRFLDTPKRGLWFDRCTTSFLFDVDQPAKASSLYHIIGAMNEYLTLRPN